MKTQDGSIGKLRRVSGNVLVTVGGLMLLGSAAAKLAHVPAVVAQLGAMGFDGNRVLFVATLEVVSALFFLVPATRSVGLLLVSSFLGGAIATHLQHGQSIAQPSVVLLLMWVGAWLRHPVILWSISMRANEQRPVGTSETIGVRGS